MDIRKLQRIVVDALDDIKAQDIRVFNTTAQTELFDRVILATGNSNRQTRALASHVRDKVKEAGGQIISLEGEETGEWVLVDLGDAVVHIMQPAIRSYYNLEEIWGEKQVRLKPSEGPAVMRANADEAPAGRKAAKKPASKRSAPAKAPAASLAGDADAGKPVTPRRRTPSRSTSAAKTPSARKTGVG